VALSDLRDSNVDNEQEKAPKHQEAQGRGVYNARKVRNALTITTGLMCMMLKYLVDLVLG